jgi:hypothetical protein
MKSRLLPLISLLYVSSAAAEIRTWTNVSGRTLQAEMTGMDPVSRSVKVKLADGRELALPISALSTEDIAFAASEWRKMQTNGTADATPVPGATAPTGSVNVKLLPARYAGRISEASRLALLQKNGGTPEIEQAVKLSLEWLKNQQEADGSWNGPDKTGMTGFALQCFTGHGEMPGQGELGDAVLKACLYLINTAASNPQGMIATDVKSSRATYAHGIATTALGEAFILNRASGTGVPNLKQTFEKAVQLIIDSQNERGSWTYGGTEVGKPTAYNPDSRGEDLSLANWQIQALVVAKESGLPIKGLPVCLKKIVNYVQSQQTRDGGYGGPNRDTHYNQWFLTGGSVLALQMLNTKAESSIAKGLRFLESYLQAEPPDWNKNANLYSWTSNTAAFMNKGGGEWDRYARVLFPQILGAQQPNGIFRPGKADWPAADAVDPIYRQTLCTLQLEVFYRYAK